MGLYRANYAVISGGHFRSNVTPNGISCYAGWSAYGWSVRQGCCLSKPLLVQESEELLPKFPQVIKRFTEVLAPELRRLGQLTVQPATYPYHDLIRH